MPTERPLVTMSAGNYCKAFAYLTSDFQRRLVLMPTTAPVNRQNVIEVVFKFNVTSFSTVKTMIVSSVMSQC